jgi:hypothetical protein
MKKAIVILYLLSLQCTGQESNPFFIDISEMIVRNNDGYYNANGLAIGKNYLLDEESSLDLSISYRFSGNLKGLNAASFTFKSHLLGVNFKYNFWPIEQKIRPFIGIGFYSELVSDYKDGLLMAQSHKPTNRYSKRGERFSARWYKGTPLVGHFFFGFNTRLIPSLYLKTALGIGYERVRSKSLSWIDGEIENPLETADKQPMKISGVFSWNLLIGLRYEISLKNKPKPQ